LKFDPERVLILFTTRSFHSLLSVSSSEAPKSRDLRDAPTGGEITSYSHSYSSRHSVTEGAEPCLTSGNVHFRTEQLAFSN